MPYDSSLNEELFSREWESDNGKIIVSVHCYNKGAKKLQLAREIKDRRREFRGQETACGKNSKKEHDRNNPGRFHIICPPSE